MEPLDEPSWLDPAHQPPEELWGRVLVASEVELRWLLKRFGVPFDARQFQNDPGTYRWKVGYEAVRKTHGGDAADAMLGVAWRMMDVWRANADLQAAMLRSLQDGAATDEVLRQFAKAAGLPPELLGPRDEA